MMQPTLFTQRQLGRLARPKERKEKKVRIYNTWDAFPFGRFKGSSLANVARVNPDHLVWWQQTSNVQFSKSLQQLIYQSKLLAL